MGYRSGECVLSRFFFVGYTRQDLLVALLSSVLMSHDILYSCPLQSRYFLDFIKIRRGGDVIAVVAAVL